jgi:hypothetical protein
MRESGLVYLDSTSIPFSNAVLCEECRTIVNFQTKCPVCGSVALMPLGKMIKVTT